MKIDVLCFGFGPSHIVYSEIFKRCSWMGNKYCLSHTSTYEAENKQIFGQNNFYSFEEITYSDLKPPTSSINAHIVDSDKKRFRNYKGSDKESYYNAVKEKIILTIDMFKPDLILFSKSVEVPEGLLLYDIAKNKGILSAIPHSLRFLGGSFFSHSPFEKDFNFFTDKKNKDSFDYNIPSLPKLYETPLPRPIKVNGPIKSLKRFYGLIIRKPFNFSFSIIRIRLSNIFFKDRKLRKLRAKLIYKSHSIRPDFNQKYVYYPLHVTPETSINIPNPFFIDQLRAIDMIRYNLPSTHFLYIKEHPVGLAKRKIGFYKQLINRSKVRLIDIEVESKELIMHSQCVISVTGTACLEAFFLKKPSFTIGGAFFSSFLKNDMTSLKEEKFHFPTEQEINTALNALKNNSGNFIAFTPDYYNVIDEDNINNLIKCLKKFLLKEGIFK